MKSFLTGLCLLLALMGASSSVLAKDSTSKTGTVTKADYKNTIVNLNQADANTFSHYLKGIGPAKAQAIVDYRKKNGNFSSIDDLLKVPGIGEATFKGLKSNVSMSRGETTAPKKAASSSSKSSTKSSKSTDSADDSKSDSSKANSASSKSTKSSSDSKKSSKDSASKSTEKTSSKKSETNSKSTKSSKSKKADKCDTAKGKSSKDCKPAKSKKKKSTKSKKTSSKSKEDKK